MTHHVKKGQGKPAYSLFEGTTDDGVTVAQLLEEHGVIDVDIAGIATDYCVRASALDAIEHGRHVRVLTDLIAGVAAGIERGGARRARPRGRGARRVRCLTIPR